MRCFVKFIATAILVTVLAAVVLVVTCSAWNGSKEATTRKDQEAAFVELLEITPPASITSISYHEHYNHGGYERWLSFTHDAATYQEALTKGGYKPSPYSFESSTTNAPVWWPKTEPPQAILYYLDQDGTPDNEGFQFRVFMWHDPSSGRVYLNKFYWD
jgi:hypothetical protein